MIHCASVVILTLIIVALLQVTPILCMFICFPEVIYKEVFVKVICLGDFFLTGFFFHEKRETYFDISILVAITKRY